MRKIAAVLAIITTYLSVAGVADAAVKKAVVTPSPAVTAAPTAPVIPTPVPSIANNSTQNTVFFIVVAVLLVAIIWYILGMPDEEDSEKPAATTGKSAAKPRSRSSRRK